MLIPAYITTTAKYSTIKGPSKPINEDIAATNPIFLPRAQKHSILLHNIAEKVFTRPRIEGSLIILGHQHKPQSDQEQSGHPANKG